MLMFRLIVFEFISDAMKVVSQNQAQITTSGGLLILITGGSGALAVFIDHIALMQIVSPFL